MKSKRIFPIIVLPSIYSKITAVNHALHGVGLIVNSNRLLTSYRLGLPVVIDKLQNKYIGHENKNV